MENFLGLVLLTRIIEKKSSLNSYWSRNSLLQTPFFGQCMSGDRFLLITAFLHFNDNELRPNDCTDKIYKVRPVFEMLMEKWREMFSLGEHIAINESMLKWRGRLSF